jgi:hypothetical protein
MDMMSAAVSKKKKKDYGVPKAEKFLGNAPIAEQVPVDSIKKAKVVPPASSVPSAKKPSVEIEIKTLLNGSKKVPKSDDSNYSKGFLIDPNADVKTQQNRAEELRERLKKKMRG